MSLLDKFNKIKIKNIEETIAETNIEDLKYIAVSLLYIAAIVAILWVRYGDFVLKFANFVVSGILIAFVLIVQLFLLKQQIEIQKIEKDQ